MFDFILKPLGEWVIMVINTSGYLGIFFLMTIESALVPLPSEITMPFAGSLIAVGRFNLWLVSLVGALGNLSGSLLAYALGYWGQEAVVRKLVKRWGRYILFTEKEFNRAEEWFRKHGEIIVFTSRLLPAIRTFISLPAGIAKMNLKRFIIYTTVGSFFWSLFLTYVGMILGKSWQTLEIYFRKFDIGIVILGFGAIIFYLYHKIKSPR